MKIKRDINDERFSRMIRERDGNCCIFCGNSGEYKKLDNSHFWGRGNKYTRFDPENCDALCFSCHLAHESNKQGFYSRFKKSQLGEERYEALEKRAQGFMKYGKREKKLIAEILKDMEEKKDHLQPYWGEMMQRVLITMVIKVSDEK